MEFLKPPTDNLYKFISISGVVLLVLSIVYPSYLYVEAQRYIFEATRTLDLMNLEDKKYEASVERVNQAGGLLERANKRVDELNTLLDEKPLNDAARQHLTNELMSLHDLLVKEQTIEEEAKSNAAKIKVEVEHNVRLSKYYYGWSTALIRAAIVGSLLGIILTSIGFRLWYVRVQKYQDILLTKQAASEEKLSYSKPDRGDD